MGSILRRILYTLTLLTLLLTAAFAFAGGATRPVAAQGQPPPAPASSCWAVYPGTANKGIQQLKGVAALSENDVWAIGNQYSGDISKTLITHWDGAQWTVVPSPSPGAFSNDLVGVEALATDDAWAVGHYVEGGRDYRTLILHWDGKTWTQVSSPNPDRRNNALRSIDAVSPTDIWAVGTYKPEGQHDRTFTVHWDGIVWTHIPSPNVPGPDGSDTNNSLAGVAAVASHDVWAVGNRTNENGIFQILVLHWDGSEWLIAPIPNLPRGGTLNAVSAAGPSDIWAVGQAYGDPTSSYVSRTLIIRWNGTEWKIVPSPDVNLEVRAWSVLNAVAARPGGEVWAFGTFNQNKTPDQPLFLRWDGAAWSLVSSPIRTYTTTLLGAAITERGTVWAVGSRSAPDRQEGLALRHTSAPCVQTPAPIATMTPPVPIPGTESVTFPETKKTLSGLFLDYWKAHGNLAQQGYPISEPMGEVSDLNGKLYAMQYFERAVFEYHPENQPPYNVLLSQLGTFEYHKRYGKAGAPNQQPNASPGSVPVPETGKRLGGRFLKYWRENGGLMQQGYPISDEFTEISPLNGKSYTVQYFERAVFEYHPENQPPYDVLLSHLGKFRFDEQYSATNSRPLQGNVGNVVAGGKYIFWSDLGLPNQPIYGYDTERGRQMLVAEEPGSKHEMATDGTHVAWVRPLNSLTQTVAIDGLHIETGVRFSIPFTSTGIGGLALESGILYYYRYSIDGVAIIARDIATGSERTHVRRGYRTLPNGSRTLDVSFEQIAVGGGVLLWNESRYVENSPPTNSESSLHMLKIDGSMGDTVLATARGNLRSFGVSGGNVVWVFSPVALADPPNPSNRVTIYNIRTSAKRAISPEGVRASDLTINGNLVAWGEGTEVQPFLERGREYHALLKVHDMASGATRTLLRRGAYVAPRAIVGDKTLAFIQYDALKDTNDLYFAGLK